MNIRVVTLRYSESLGGFPEEPLQQVLAGGNVVEQREYFFTHGGVPHLALVLVMDGAHGASARRAFGRDREDPGDKLPDHLQPLYRSLRQWRNERARQIGVPSYVILRNVQLAEICRRLPRTLEALKQIEGVGEGTVSKYGRDILGQIPPDLEAEPPSQPATPPLSPGNEALQ